MQRLVDLTAKAADAETVGAWIVENGNIADIAMTAAGRESVAPYTAHFHKLDIWQANVARAPRGQVHISYEHTAEDKLLKTEFYNDFARQFGLLRPMGVMLQLTPHAVATVSAERLNTQMRFDGTDKPHFQRLVPYLKGALQLRLRHRANLPHTHAYVASLDALAFGTVICDARANVVFANSAAEALAAGGAGITLGRHGKGLSALIPAQSRALAELVHDAANGGAGGAMQISGVDGAAGLLVLVTPLPPPLNVLRGSGYALVSLRSARDNPAFVQASLEALFQLSPTQAAIALALYEGKSPEQIATERAVRISTLRTHLVQIFARTGAENQRDLIRLLGLLPPVRRAPDGESAAANASNGETGAPPGPPDRSRLS